VTTRQAVSDSDFKVVIPARYAAVRFPGKALAEFAGSTIVQHVWERSMASSASEVIIATDDERIAGAAKAFGAEVMMTATDHQSGTDRVAEVAGRMGWADDLVVVNVQGDAPLIPSSSIEGVAKSLREHRSAAIATTCAPIINRDEYHDPNVVKVVFDKDCRALYFSRSAIPAVAHGRPNDSGELGFSAWRHIGLYAYRVAALKQITAAEPCALEECEKLEQLRALWNGMEIRVAIASEDHGPDVDTPADLEAAVRYLASSHE
jgi:3-deoxy-manno-octulosonate cytidylyltransferase (CMP-KDO synthetase)